MRKLPKPDLDYQEHFYNCISNKSPELRSRLESYFPRLVAASRRYETHANNVEFFKISSIGVGASMHSALTVLYRNQMAKKKASGRNVYDRIIISAGGQCPFCTHGTPKTLDHYLPQTDFPEFSVFPANLIPCCKDCNHEKGTHSAQNQFEQFIHPYFEDISQLQWLESKIDYSMENAPSFIFFVNESVEGLGSTLFARLKFQFKKLNLNKIYSIQAGNELTGIESHIRAVQEEGGANEVKSYLQSLARSRTEKNKNSWQAAMYRAMAIDDEFCVMNWSL